ncbi:MAG: non-ribosomal peptide synthetase [Variovorax sp.]
MTGVCPRPEDAATSLEIETLQALLSRHARMQPARVALLAPGHPSISYAQLSSVVGRMRGFLRAHGLGTRSRIAVLLPQGLALAIANVSIACQATVIALHPGLSEAELSELLADARADALLGPMGDPVAARLAHAHGLVPLSLDLAQFMQDQGESPHAFEDDGDAWPGPEDTAFVLFTSGTTGKPKRVPISQRQVVCSARNIADHLALRPEDRGLSMMPAFHSHGLVGALLAPLAAGSSVVCTSGFDASSLLQWLAEFDPTWYTAAPTIHQSMADLGMRAGAKLPPHRLRFIRSASSALSPELLQRLEIVWAAPVIESYGMTETATQMASNPVGAGLRKAGSVGMPAGAELRVVDAQGNAQVTGLTGSIMVRGPAVFSGYEDAPVANAQAFRDGWFDTGDLGWFDEDGYLHVEGRAAEIINRGGEKIAPFEVERALLRLPAVAQAVAYPVPHPTLGEDVHAAVVLAPGHDADAHGLRAALFGVIASFKVPACISVLDSIPTGSGGKVRRRDLHHDIARAPVASRPAAGLRNRVEVRVAALFAETLACDVDDADANFLALGGDSLSAARLAHLASETWGIELPASTALVEPTVGGFAACVQAAIDEADALIASAHADIQSLSDEEVARLLGPNPSL